MWCFSCKLGEQPGTPQTGYDEKSRKSTATKQYYIPCESVGNELAEYRKYPNTLPSVFPSSTTATSLPAIPNNISKPFDGNSSVTSPLPPPEKNPIPVVTGYQLFSRDCINGIHGSVCLYIKETIEVKYYLNHTQRILTFYGFLFNGNAFHVGVFSKFLYRTSTLTPCLVYHIM